MGYSFKSKKGIIITNALQNILEKLNHKPNEIWVEKGSKFYNRSMKSFFRIIASKCIQRIMKENNRFTERFMRTFKNIIYKIQYFSLKKCVYW